MGDIKKKVNIGVDDTHVIKLANSIIKDAFKSRASDIHIEWLRKQAIESGMITLREDGIDKVKQGITTIEEVLRVVPGH